MGTQKSAEYPTDRVSKTSPARARLSEAPETFWVSKAILSSFISKNRQVNTPETSYMKKNSVHIKNTLIKQHYDHKLRDFVMAFRVRLLLGTFSMMYH